MRSLMEFLGVWCTWIALAVGTILAALWALSIDSESSDGRAAKSLLRAMLWPILWLQLWLTGKRERFVRHRGTGSGSSMTAVRVDARDQSAARFRTVREAKDFLVSAIANEAANAGAPLTEVERKMLYFTESGWMLPGMKEVSAQFDRDYDQDAYEKKIASIVARIQARFPGENEEEQMRWDGAVEKLSEGDHYLLVLIDAASPARKGAKHNLKLLIAALVFFGLAILNGWFRQWLREH